MLDITPEKMFIFLPRSVNCDWVAICDNLLSAINPADVSAISGFGRPTNSSTSCCTFPFVAGQCLLLYDGDQVVLDIQIIAILLGHWRLNLPILKLAVLPGNITAVFIGHPDLLPQVIDCPFAVTLLLGHVDAHRHFFLLNNVVGISINTFLRDKSIFLSLVAPL